MGQGGYGFWRNIAAAERISTSYIARVLNLSLLAPENVEAILNGGQLRTLTGEELTRGLPNDWRKQAELLR